MTTNSILPADFDQQIADARECAERSLRRLHAALGGVMLTTQPTDALAKDHFIAIDDEARNQYNMVAVLLQSLCDMAALARAFQSQRNDVLGALYDATNINYADAAKVSANVYLRLRDNISVTFNCTEETADGFLHALWDQNAQVDDALGELLDRVADTIGKWG